MDFFVALCDSFAGFLLHLFKDRKLQPSIIEGYRMAFAGMVGHETASVKMRT